MGLNNTIHFQSSLTPDFASFLSDFLTKPKGDLGTNIIAADIGAPEATPVLRKRTAPTETTPTRTNTRPKDEFVPASQAGAVSGIIIPNESRHEANNFKALSAEDAARYRTEYSWGKAPEAKVLQGISVESIVAASKQGPQAAKARVIVELPEAQAQPTTTNMVRSQASQLRLQSPMEFEPSAVQTPINLPQAQPSIQATQLPTSRKDKPVLEQASVMMEAPTKPKGFFGKLVSSVKSFFVGTGKNRTTTAKAPLKRNPRGRFARRNPARSHAQSVTASTWGVGNDVYAKI